MADKSPAVATAPPCCFCGGPYAAQDGTPRFCEFCRCLTDDEIATLPPLPYVEPVEVRPVEVAVFEPVEAPVFEKPDRPRRSLRNLPALFWLAVFVAGLVASIVLVVAR